MDEEWLQAANTAVDSIEHTATTSSELSGGAPNLQGGPQTRIGGLLDLPQPHRVSFQRMMAHPAVQHRLSWMGGSGMRGGMGSIFASRFGASGHLMHNNGEPLYPHMGYEFQNGRSLHQSVTVTWQLRDVKPGDGGCKSNRVKPINVHFTTKKHAQ